MRARDEHPYFRVISGRQISALRSLLQRTYRFLARTIMLRGFAHNIGLAGGTYLRVHARGLPSQYSGETLPYTKISPL